MFYCFYGYLQLYIERKSPHVQNSRCIRPKSKRQVQTPALPFGGRITSVKAFL